jgi:hypothetical protein
VDKLYIVPMAKHSNYGDKGTNYGDSSLK